MMVLAPVMTGHGDLSQQGVCVCVCARVCARVCVCACLCVCRIRYNLPVLAQLIGDINS